MSPLFSRLTTFDKRKSIEHDALKEMCERTKKISFRVLKTNRKKVPIEYEVTYSDVKGIVGIKEDKSPKFDTIHKLIIKLGPKYPDPPAACFFTTPMWHPNIKSSGATKGRVCYNSKDLPANYRLDELVEFIGKMIQYKNYHAILDKEPYPEDVDAAKWVTEYAEPNGLINFKKNKAIDDNHLLDPMEGYEPPKDSGITFF